MSLGNIICNWIPTWSFNCLSLSLSLYLSVAIEKGNGRQLQSTLKSTIVKVNRPLIRRDWFHVVRIHLIRFTRIHDWLVLNPTNSALYSVSILMPRTTVVVRHQVCRLCITSHVLPRDNSRIDLIDEHSHNNHHHLRHPEQETTTRCP